MKLTTDELAIVCFAIFAILWLIMHYAFAITGVIWGQA